MNYRDIYNKRHKALGATYKDSFRNQSKIMANEGLLNSFDRVDIKVNFTEDYTCIPRDIDTYEIRKFLFPPDSKIYKGDYIGFDGFTYLVINANTSDIYPSATAQLCNFNIPIKIEIISDKTQVIGKESNGRPIYKSETITITKPCVMTAKIYSTADNSSVPLPDGSMSVLLPYAINDTLPELNQKITYEQSQYKVTDLIYQNVVYFGDIKKGYIEIRLQREANTNV